MFLVLPLKRGLEKTAEPKRRTVQEARKGDGDAPPWLGSVHNRAKTMLWSKLILYLDFNRILHQTGKLTAHGAKLAPTGMVIFLTMTVVQNTQR